MRIGDLIKFKILDTGTKAYHKFPGEYDYHSVIWTKSKFGIILEIKDTFIRALLDDGMVLWFDGYKVDPIT